MRRVAVALSLGSMVLTAAADTLAALETCAVTRPVWAGPGDDPADFALPGGWWYVNSNRTIWAGWDAASLAVGPQSNKVAWLRPKGTHLEVSTRRLDADAGSAEVDIPCCSGGRFQASGLTFPTGGCWEISARAGSEGLTFVTYVSTRGVGL